MEPPSAGAIVTPEDKAAGMDKNDEDARNQNADTSDDNASNVDEMDVNPDLSKDDDSSINPGHPYTDDASPRYGTPATPGSMMEEDSAEVPPRTGWDVRLGDMGPGNMRGQ